MARLLDYQFDTFSTDTNGNRITPNAGTLGSANDAVLYTGQGLYFDGVDDEIDTGILPNSAIRTLICKFRCDNISDIRRPFFGKNFLGAGVWDDTSLYMRFGGTYASATSSAGNYGADIIQTVTFDEASGTAYVYKNNEAPYSRSASLIVDSADPTYSYRITDLVAGSGTLPFKGIAYWSCILTKYITSSDVDYIYNNEEALLNMVITGNSDPNLSFTPADIFSYIPLTEGTGSTVYDLVTGDAYAMTNFPTDDTQWTNADELPNTIQKCRYKKDANGNPSSLADPSTIRFD